VGGHGEEGLRERAGVGGEMTQILYAHINKQTKKNVEL
jgi:hypothetical protein